MKRIERSALVSFSCQQMFALVNDIAAYPEYMSGCVGSEVLARGDDWLEARLDIERVGLRQSFVTRNQLLPPHEMRMQLVSGPFRELRGAWRFQALSGDACKVVFWLEYAFSNPIFALAAGKIFDAVASEQVDALGRRAKSVYAKD